MAGEGNSMVASFGSELGNTLTIDFNAKDKVTLIKVIDKEGKIIKYGTALKAGEEYTYFIEKHTIKPKIAGDYSDISGAVNWICFVKDKKYYTNNSFSKPSLHSFDVETLAEKGDAEQDYINQSTLEGEEQNKENFKAIADNGILFAEKGVGEIKYKDGNKEVTLANTAYVKIKYSKFLDAIMLQIEGQIGTDAFVKNGSSNAVASRKIVAAPEIVEVYWTTKDGERIEKTGYSETIYMHMVSLGLQEKTIEAFVLERDDNNPDNLSQQGDQIEWENNRFVIDDRTFTRQFKVISKEEGEEARKEDVNNGDSLFKMTYINGLESQEDLELYLQVGNASDLDLDDTATYGDIILTIEDNIVDAYFAKITEAEVALDAPLEGVFNNAKKKIGEKNTKGKDTKHEKLTEGVIGQKIKLVAEVDNMLEEGTKILFQLFEKERLLTLPDTPLTVVQNDKEVSVVEAEIKDGYAIAEIELSKFDTSLYKSWDSKLDTAGADEEKKSLVYLKVKEKDSNAFKDFLVDDNFELNAATIKCKIFQNGSIERNDINFPKKIKYYYVENNNTNHFIGDSKLIEADKWLVKGVKVKPTQKVVLVDARNIGSYSSGNVKFKFEKWNSSSKRWWINIDCFAGLIGAMIEESIEDLAFNGFSQIDGKPGGSQEHINGVAGDLRYLSENSNGELIYISDPKYKFDYERQVKFNNALYKFYWGRTRKMYSENFYREIEKEVVDEKTKKKVIKKVKEKTLLPHTKHMRKEKDGKIVYRHDHHLHMIGFDFSQVKIK